jgi:hypothetical protein
MEKEMKVDHRPQSQLWKRLYAREKKKKDVTIESMTNHENRQQEREI